MRLIEFDTDDNGEVVGGGADFIVLGRIGPPDGPVLSRCDGLGIAALRQDIVKTAVRSFLGERSPGIGIAVTTSAKGSVVFFIE